MNFENLMHYDLMTELYRINSFLLICSFDIDRIRHIAEFKAWKI